MKVNLEEVADNFSGLICFDGKGSVSIYQCNGWWYFPDSLNIKGEVNKVSYQKIYDNENFSLTDFDLSKLTKESYRTNEAYMKCGTLMSKLSDEERQIVLDQLNNTKKWNDFYTF